jgi:hypothetical protein
LIDIANVSKASQTFRCQVCMNASVLPPQMAHADYRCSKGHSLRKPLFGLA